MKVLIHVEALGPEAPSWRHTAFACLRGQLEAGVEENGRRIHEAPTLPIALQANAVLASLTAIAR